MYSDPSDALQTVSKKLRAESTTQTTTIAEITTQALVDTPNLDFENSAMGSDWFSALKGEMSKPYFRKIKTALDKDKKAGKTIFPPGASQNSREFGDHESNGRMNKRCGDVFIYAVPA